MENFGLTLTYDIIIKQYYFDEDRNNTFNLEMFGEDYFETRS